MSLKPLKKSDLGKDWVGRRRGKAVRIQPEYQLIFTEGTNTEPLYFNRMKEVIDNKFHDRIQLKVEGAGKKTISLFQKARKYVDNSPNDFRHVWIVFDTDDFPAGNIDQVIRLCDQTGGMETVYHAIWSNQCIELWYLLHFSYIQSDLHRTEYWPKLTGSLRALGEEDYSKNRKDMFDVLRPFLDTAIQNAKKLEERNKGRTASASTPGTMIHKLMETMRPYLL